MHVFHKSSSYLSNFRLETDGSLEHERQILVQEQKLCKARARKFSLETNRRRKALDERRKRWDIQEKHLRENILQQRRQQVQEATERFQRAHLPHSRRCRQSLRRDVPNIEDALSQIQGSLSSHVQHSSLLSSTTNFSRSSTPSPTPPTAPKCSPRQALSEVEAYAKLLQEQCRIEQLQDHSLQGSHDSDSCISESLSSKDSLEDEDSNQNTSNLQRSSSLFLLDSKKAHSEQKKQNDLCPTSASFSAMMLLDENLAQLRKLHEPLPRQEKQEDSEWTNNGVVVSEALWDFTSMEKVKTENCPTPHNNNLLAPFKLPKGDQGYSEMKLLQKNHNDSNLVTNRVVLGNPDESPYSKQEALLNLKEQRIHDDGLLKYPSSTDISFPSKNGSSKDMFLETSPKNNTADNFTNNRILLTTEKEKYLSSRKNPCVSINNLKVSNSECKTEKAMNAEFLSNASLSKIQSERHKSPEEEETSSPVSVATSHSVRKVKVIKGILKKQSSYMARDSSCTYGPDRLLFAKHLALALRDSVELTRAKTKDLGVNNTVKKKLRWFDEVHTGEDHQPSLTKELRSPELGPNMTPAASTGYHFTKEAWADVGVQVNLPQEQVDGVKVAHSSAKNDGSNVPQRARSSRTGGGAPVLWTRKGAVIRPQSATEVNQIAKTQGKIMAPRPPPRTELHIIKTSYGTNHAGIKYKQALVIEEAPPKNNSVRIFSPKTRDVITTDSNVVYTTLPHCFLSEGNTKGVAISGHQEFQHSSVFREKRLCLDVTPTDEEISQLWHGVRSALNTKDDKRALPRPALEGRQASQQPSSGQSRQPPGSANTRLLQPSQNPELLRTCSSTRSTALNDGLEMKTQFVPEGLWKDSQAVGGALENAQTLRPGREKQQEITSLSLEEKKILLSLEKLNQQLSYLHEHNAGPHALTLTDAPLTKEMKVANNYKQRTSSAHRAPYQKKV